MSSCLSWDEDVSPVRILEAQNVFFLENKVSMSINH